MPQTLNKSWARRALLRERLARLAAAPGEADLDAIGRQIDVLLEDAFEDDLVPQPARAWNSGTSAAIRQGDSPGSQSVIWRTPLRPSTRPFQNASRPMPSGVTAPMPVTTARRERSAFAIDGDPRRAGRRGCGSQSPSYRLKITAPLCPPSPMLFDMA